MNGIELANLSMLSFFPPQEKIIFALHNPFENIFTCMDPLKASI